LLFLFYASLYIVSTGIWKVDALFPKQWPVGFTVVFATVVAMSVVFAVGAVGILILFLMEKLVERYFAWDPGFEMELVPYLLPTMPVSFIIDFIVSVE